MNIIGEFQKEYRFLSNFYPCSFKWRGVTWPTVEHAYQAAKNPASMDMIRKQSSPGKAKKVARLFKPIPEWENKKLEIMEELVRIKFNMPRFKDRLKATGDAILTEGNYWHDNFWGNCICRECLAIPGLNHLGKILMKVRDEISKD